MYEELKKLGVQIKANAPLAKYTTFKIGGPARFLALPKTVDEFVAVVRFCEQNGVPFFILGSGSNMLVGDEGYDGVVIHPLIQTVEVQGNEVVADAGALTVQVARASVAAGLTGFEWAVGVPGTVGGAVRGNAGCMGGEIKDSLVWVEVYKDGEVQRLTNAQCDFHYRESIFKREGGVIVRACFKLAPDSTKQGAKKMVEFLGYRTKTQPKTASSGCMFKNVPLAALSKNQHNIPEDFIKKQKVPAGWLVQEAGGKGMRVGGATVSEVHGNFIVNDAHATAADVKTLVEQIKEKVAEKFGVELEEEVQII